MQRGDFQEGAYYSIRQNGDYGVAKVLVVDGGGVHLRLFGNSWPTRPSQIEPGDLDLQFAIGHLALTRRHFAAWQPTFLQQGTVGADELGGYRDWQQFGGDYFDVQSD